MSRPPFTWHPDDREPPRFLHDLPRPSIVAAFELVLIAWAFIAVLVFA